MPRRVFSFDQPDRFICGAIGEPGRRTFFLQAAKGSQVVSVALEKAQVAVLAERLATLLLALRQGGVSIDEAPATDTPRLAEPVIEQFRVGTLTLAWDGERERVVIEAREIGDEEEEDDEDDEEGEVEEEAAEEPALMETALPQLPQLIATDVGEGGDVVRVQLAPVAALAFASGAQAVVHAGRPPCPQCGAPLDPGGHFCPRRNGYTH